LITLTEAATALRTSLAAIAVPAAPDGKRCSYGDAASPRFAVLVAVSPSADQPYKTFAETQVASGRGSHVDGPGDDAFLGI
jgi:hypothetical protein